MSDSAQRPLRVLFSCVGRRVELVQAFRASAARRGYDVRLYGTDCTPTAPALAAVDEALLVPRIAEDHYLDSVLQLCKEHQIDALVPTIDTELALLANARQQFTDLGCQCLVPDPRVVDICSDKAETYRFLHSNGVDTPETWEPDTLQPEALTYPCLIKPRRGSASMGVHKLNDREELDFYLPRIPDPVVQEFVPGIEHTLDVYVGLTGAPRCVVPRRRWAVRGGEVVKGVVVKDREIMEAGLQLANVLGPSTRGLVTLQCMVSEDRRIRFIEINPRFGGGAPLGIAAGADYPGWLLDELLGKTPQVALDDFRHGTCMLRYDWSVFTQLDDDLTPELRPPLYDVPVNP